MAGTLQLPSVDLFSADRAASVLSIRQACLDYAFFYLTNHGIGNELLQQVFHQSKNFFSLSLDEKLKFQLNKDHRGYTPPFAENLDPSSKSKGDLKESFYIGPANCSKVLESNQWPSEGELKLEDYGNFGASAHSDYGMITLLATDGVPGLQICREKNIRPQLWEQVPHIEGAFIINIGDLLERWTNCLYRSTLHRVVATGKERFSVAFFLEPNSDCLVECLKSCCSETCPPRFPPTRSGDYLQERLRATYSNHHRYSMRICSHQPSG